jgi:hypothetical protein
MFLIIISGINFSLLVEVFRILKNYLGDVKLQHVKKTKKILTQSLDGKTKEDFLFKHFSFFLQVENRKPASLKKILPLLPEGVSIKLSKVK